MRQEVPQVDRFSVIGKRLPDIDGPQKVTGQAQFTADIVLPGMLHGKILRSPYPHARIVSIDTSKAGSLPGVKCVITGKDTPGILFGCITRAYDQYPLAIGKVRHVGEAVAAVAAIDEDTAEEALELVHVEYEELPAVVDPEEGMKDGAPQIHDKSSSPEIHDAQHNISRYAKWEFGDVDKGFAEADHIREDRFTTPGQNHAPMEPHAAVASADSTGNITVWSSTQIPFFLRYNLAKTLAIPESKVRVIKPFVGGGFGGKVDMYAKDFCAALLSLKTGRPVKIVYTRKEVFIATGQSFPKILNVRTGVKKDGTITAQELKVIYDNGAYNSSGPMIVWGLGTGDLAYKLPAERFEGILVYTNKTFPAPLRGHTIQQILFAIDVQLEMIAADLGIDPADMLAKNAVTPGYVRGRGDRPVGSCALKECIQSVVERSGWKEKRGKMGPYRGIGLACGGFSGAGAGNVRYNPVRAMIQVNADGRVTLYTGAPDIGQGSNSTLAQIAAEELGVSQDDITVIASDTAISPFDHGSFGSRVTMNNGLVVQQAAADTRRQLLEAAAELMEARAEQIDMRERRVFLKDNPERGMTFIEMLKGIQRRTKLPIIGVSEMRYPEYTGFTQSWVFESPQISFYADVAEVEVDPETGKIKISNLYYAHDCGTAINPMRTEGQLEGSAQLALGMALSEQMLYDKGQPLNTSFLDYKVPASVDMPRMQGGHVEPERIPSVETGPWGAKEAGEGATVAVAPAIINALHDATGIWFKDLPVTPDKVLKALREKKEA